jgi:hypothetical protein
MFFRAINAGPHIRGFHIRLSFEKRNPASVEGLLYCYCCLPAVQGQGRARKNTLVKAWKQTNWRSQLIAKHIFLWLFLFIPFGILLYFGSCFMYDFPF